MLKAPECSFGVVQHNHLYARKHLAYCFSAS